MKMKLIELSYGTLPLAEQIIETHDEPELTMTSVMAYFIERYHHLVNCTPETRTACQHIFIAVNATGKPVGACNVERYPLYKSDGNIEYYVVPSERNNRYSESILRLAISFCRNESITPVFVTISKTNVKSRKCALACGFMPTGTMYEWNNGLIGDEFILRLQ